MKIITTLMFVSFFAFAQGQDSAPIDIESFLVGTLPDYLGRSTHRAISDRVDVYYLHEQRLASYLDSLFKGSVPDLELRKNDDRTEIYSKTLSDKINNYYQYEPSSARTLQGDTIYVGKLKSDQFNTDEKILSFIAGTYVRFGEQNDSTTCMRINNSLSKAQICTEFLKAMNCKNVRHQILHRIPTNHLVYFDPTPELSAYLGKVMGLRKQLDMDMRRVLEASR